MSDKLILIADDHVIIRRGIKMILNEHFRKEKILEADSAKDILSLLNEHPVTHMILDMQLSDTNIIDILPSVRESFANIPILIYTMSSEDVYGLRMLQMGVKGFLSKQSDEQEAIKALDLFFQGKQYISENLKDIMTSGRPTDQANPILSLSSREISVMNNLLNGENIKQISISLSLKPTTVGTYKARIFEKMQVKNVMELRDKCDLYHYKVSS